MAHKIESHCGDIIFIITVYSDDELDMVNSHQCPMQARLNRLAYNSMLLDLLLFNGNPCNN